MMIVKVVNDPFSFHNHFTLITQHTDTAVAENRNSPQHSHFCQPEFMVSFLPFYLDMKTQDKMSWLQRLVLNL